MTITLNYPSPLQAGNSWTFTVLITAPDDVTIYQSAIVFLISPYSTSSVAGATMVPLTGYVTMLLTATANAREFTGTATLSQAETSKLLAVANEPLSGLKETEVEMIAIVYQGTTSPVPGTDQGETMKTDTITPFIAPGMSTTLQQAV